MQKAWIDKMMERGLCSCDDEHMFDCPRDTSGGDDLVDVKSPPSAADVEQQAFDDVLDRILGEKVCTTRHHVSLCLYLSVGSRGSAEL